jgi:hypothetical protein
VASPVCDAVIEQVPTASSVIVPPETVQMLGEFDVNATASPLVAEAPSVSGPPSTAVAPGPVKAIDCVSGAAVTSNERLTPGAAAYVALPGCAASIVQVPVATSVTLVPETVQTLGVLDENDTARLLDAVAVSETGP